MSILVFGDVIDDILIRPLDAVTTNSDTRAEIRRRPGGSAANQAAWLGYLGGSVSFVGRVGAPDVDRHTDELGAHGVDVRLIPDDFDTGTIVVLRGDTDERTMFTDRGASLHLHRRDIPDALLRQSTHLHVTGYSLFEHATRTQTLEILAAARTYGIPFSVDPSSVAFLREVGGRNFLDWTRGSVACFPNLDEARCLTGLDSPAAVSEALADDYPVVAVTTGAAGVVVAQGTNSVALPALAADCVDPTGAGDAFCAGFLHHWLAGADPIAAARSGMAVAAQAIGQLGARPPSPDRSAP